MSESEPRRSKAKTFSLLNVLTLTAFIAIGTALFLAYRKNRLKYEQRDKLLWISSRLQVANADELASRAMPKIANDFQSWQIYIPGGQDYELRLGIGSVSEYGIPPIVGSVPITSGQHRVTLHAADSPAEKFQYRVYVDGEQVIEKSMGSDWIPGGWASSSSLSWPRDPKFIPPPLQLSAQSYKSKTDFGAEHYFNGQSDNYVTRNGYRLWIDQSARTVASVSPFIVLSDDFQFYGIGLRDGLRYKISAATSYDWMFIQPKSETNDPVLRIAAEFVTEDGTTLSSQTQAFQAWQLRGEPPGKYEPIGQSATEQPVYRAFLHAKLKSADAPQPIVEMKWEASRPDEVGLRLAVAAENDRLRKWRLRILDGTKHLWREMHVGDRMIKADNAIDDIGGTTDATFTMELGGSPTMDAHLRWQTDETLPLQVLERKEQPYAAMQLFTGLPLTFEIQIPASLKPTLAAVVIEDDPGAPDKPFPGGAVFDELQFEFDARRKDWIWLTVKAKK